MKYQVLEEDEVFDSVEDVVDYCIYEEYHEGDDYFDEWVNDRFDGVEINGYEYTAHEIIRAMDDDNWRELRDQYCEECNEEDREEAIRALNRAEDGDEIEIQCYTVRVIDDESAVGDFDGDEAIEAIRAQIEATKVKTEEEKKIEEDLMQLFQIIGD